MDQEVKNKLLKRTLTEYVERVLDPLETQLADEVSIGYESLGCEGNDPAYFRGKIAGLRVAFGLLKQLQKDLYKEDQD